MRIRVFLIVMLAASVMALILSPVTEGQQPRLNRVVDALSQGKVSIGVSSGGGADLDGIREMGATRGADTNIDFLFMSQANPLTFSIPNLKAYMAGLVEGGATSNPSTHPMLLRVPTVHEDTEAAKQRIQQALDAGVYNFMFPHMETAEEALFAIRAMRYPAQDVVDGTRPNTAGEAPSVWGVSEAEYRAKADLWPLDPNGELTTVILLESVDAVEKHAREITAVSGATIVIPAPGDLRSAYTAQMFPNLARGRGGQPGGRGGGRGLNDVQQAALQEQLEEAFAMQLAICVELDVVCGITAGEQDIERRIRQGFRFIIANSQEAVRLGHAAAGND
jgi:4-hydroxy-2-oxoheptanedioate aldolase